MATKQKKAQNDILLLEYYRYKFKNVEEIENFAFVCIGPSRSSPVAGPVPKEGSHLQVRVGDRINIKICRQMKCTCTYADRLIRFAAERKEQEKDIEDKRRVDEKNKEIARRIALGDSTEDTGREQKTEERKREPEERKQDTKEKTGHDKVSESENGEDSLEDLLFG